MDFRFLLLVDSSKLQHDFNNNSIPFEVWKHVFSWSMICDNKILRYCQNEFHFSVFFFKKKTVDLMFKFAEDFNIFGNCQQNLNSIIINISPGSLSLNWFFEFKPVSHWFTIQVINESHHRLNYGISWKKPPLEGPKYQFSMLSCRTGMRNTLNFDLSWSN